MNGPEHYAEAQRLAAESAELFDRRDAAKPTADGFVRSPERLTALAQVHATLALADEGGWGDLLIRLDSLRRDLENGALAPALDDDPAQWMAAHLDRVISGEPA